MSAVNGLLEQGLPIVQEFGLNSNKAIDFSGAPSMAMPAGATIGGSAVVALGTITSTAAAAFAVGANGATGPSFQVDDSTASQASGLKVVGGTAAGTVALSAISTATAASLTVDALGSGKVKIGTVNATDVVIGSTTGVPDFTFAEITGGTGASATLVTVGAAAGGPGTAAQDGWMKVKIAGTAVYIPVWK